MAMKHPVHPGVLVREDCLKALGLTLSEGAERLGVGRRTFAALLRGRTAVSIGMARRLSQAFGSTPQTWLAMQRAYDRAQSRQMERESGVGRTETR